MKSIIVMALTAISFNSFSQKDTTLYGYIDSVNYRQAEIKSCFPGGDGAWAMYLRKNFRYPNKAYKNNIMGTVIVEYTVSLDGFPSDLKVYKSVDPDLDNEAIRLIQKARWVPAVQNGRQVVYRTRTPIIFKLGD